MRKQFPASMLVVALFTLPAPRAEALFPAKGGEDLHVGAADETPSTEQYEDRAYPAAYIDAQRQASGFWSFRAVAERTEKKSGGWQSLGPTTPAVPGVVTFTGRATVTSGRVTALAVSPRCHADDCKILVAAAGGGVWAADNGLAPRPNWHPSNDGIPSNAIGSIVFDPTDPKGRRLYAGTGEGSGSSDSEAGVGLFRSTDAGRSWSLVPGSVAVALSRSIDAIAVDPADPNHLFIGTAVARHGSSSVNGGRYTPPGAPPVGLYESKDAGANFALAFSQASDVVNPTSPNGSDFFRAGVTKIALDRTGLAAGQPSRVFASLFDYGLFRSSPADEAGNAGYKPIFASAGGGLVANSIGARTEFALAPMGGRMRIYVGDTDGNTPADFFRVDDANVPAAALSNGVVNAGWTRLSDPAPGTPGHGSFDFCGGQCSYDMVVASPPGQPDAVWIGGQMQYGEIFAASNGRAVQRSVDAGATFTDMTNDTQSPPLGMHPDQHAIAFAGDPNIAFCGSDGGVVRTSGEYADASAGCSSRGLSGTDLADCRIWLASIPARILSLNDGLDTLQFQSVSLNAQDPLNDLLGGTQDNGTWAFDGSGRGSWFETVGGDGGQSGIDVANPSVRMHTYFNPQTDVNFQGTDPLGWDWTADPFFAKPREASSFYVPLVNDPFTSGSWFMGLQHVWRTQDDGGQRAFLDLHCNELFGDFPANVVCGDWVQIGGTAGDLTVGPASDKGTGYVVAIRRAVDPGTMWVATRRGRLFVSTNAGDPAASVTFTRVDGPAQPRRFISGVVVDPSNPFHVWVSFSGYDAYTPSTPGHVFEVVFQPATSTATWTDLSKNLGDQPITGIARDDATGDLFAATDFGVAILEKGDDAWAPASTGLPLVAVYGLTIDSRARALYAATHGRGVYRLALDR